MQFPLQIGRLTGVQASHVQHAPAVCSYNEAYPSSNCCLHKASPQSLHSTGANSFLLPLILALPRVSPRKEKGF